MKKVAIIIVTYNAKKYLKPLLESLNRLNYPKDDFGIFVIDNDSTDETIKKLEIKKLETSNLTIIKNGKNLGFAGGNNIGMKWAIETGYEYIVLLNQDTEVDENWLSELVKIAESDEKIGVAQSLILLARDRDKINSSGERLNYLGIGYSGNYQLSIINYQSENNIISYASGASVLYKSKILKQVGFFDESFFMYHEDSDLSWRIRLAGLDIALAKNSICYHDYRFNHNPKTFYFTERNRLAFLMKNFGVKTLILIFPMFMALECGILFYALFTGWIRQKILAYDWFAENFDNILKSRRAVQSLRQRSDHELKKYLVAGIEFGGLENPVLKYLANPALKVYWRLIGWLI